MSQIPDNWIDKIFELLSLYYGDRWNKQFKNKLEIDLYKTVWFNGLNGLSYEQLRHGLAVCKKYSSSYHAKPPSVVTFFHFCIGLLPKNVPCRTLIAHK